MTTWYLATEPTLHISGYTPNTSINFIVHLFICSSWSLILVSLFYMFFFFLIKKSIASIWKWFKYNYWPTFSSFDNEKLKTSCQESPPPSRYCHFKAKGIPLITESKEKTGQWLTEMVLRKLDFGRKLRSDWKAAEIEGFNFLVLVSIV